MPLNKTKDRFFLKSFHFRHASFYRLANDFDNYFVENAGEYDSTVKDIKNVKKKSLEYIKLIEMALLRLKEKWSKIN